MTAADINARIFDLIAAEFGHGHALRGSPWHSGGEMPASEAIQHIRRVVAEYRRLGDTADDISPLPATSDE